MCKIWWFFLTARKKKPIHCLERPQHAFLDHSKTHVFSDIIKWEIIFKYSCAHTIRISYSRGKKTIWSHLNVHANIIVERRDTVYDGAHKRLQKLDSTKRKLDSFVANLNSPNANLNSTKRKLDSFDATLNSTKRKLDSLKTFSR